MTSSKVVQPTAGPPADVDDPAVHLTMRGRSIVTYAGGPPAAERSAVRHVCVFRLADCQGQE
jgi:hypothetical protein